MYEYPASLFCCLPSSMALTHWGRPWGVLGERATDERGDQWLCWAIGALLDIEYARWGYSTLVIVCRNWCMREDDGSEGTVRRISGLEFVELCSGIVQQASRGTRVPTPSPELLWLNLNCFSFLSMLYCSGELTVLRRRSSNCFRPATSSQRPCSLFITLLSATGQDTW
jgi:hypothetical protein